MARHLMGISRDLQARLMQRLSEECGYRALRPSLGTLLSLVYLESRPLGALASRLAISKQACSQLVAHAAGGGYVERRPDPVDRRSKHVVLTDRGRALVEDAIRIIFDCESIYADVLGEGAYRRFTRTLARLFELEVPSPAASELTERARRTIGVLPMVAERVQRDLMEATLAHGHRGLKMSHAQVLPLIGPEGARAHVLAKLQGVSRQAIHATARDLEELGILVREPDPRDRRGALLRLTRRGGRVLEDSVAAIEGLEAAFREVLGDAGYAELADGARQLFRALHLEEEIFGAPSDRPTTATPVAEGDTDIPRLARRLRRELGRRDALRLAALLDADASGSNP
ncbi:MAG: MarR family transcriptional regulator [Myxococcota bacterium]